jgi:CheY-like chemotaxis protein
MPTGGTLTISAEVVPAARAMRSPEKTTPDDNIIRIVVKDTGVGIPPENRTRIFEPFFTTHGRAKARGMGLPMVQGMVAQHGGWMEIKTEVGLGTEVSIQLPIKEAPATVGGVVADADGTLPVATAAEPGRLLIADDEPFIRRLIRKIFQSEGWKIDEADDYQMVMDKIDQQGQKYDLIILDLTMPGPTTEETVQRIAELNADTHVLFVSGYSKDARIERLMEMIHSDFIGKPFSPKALLSKVDDLVSG